MQVKLPLSHEAACCDLPESRQPADGALGKMRGTLLRLLTFVLMAGVCGQDNWWYGDGGKIAKLIREATFRISALCLSDWRQPTREAKALTCR